MSYTQGLYPIQDKKSIAKGIYDMTILCPEVASVAKAGQFVHIAVPAHTLRRPISICGIDRLNGTIRIVFEIRGKGTEEIANLNKGDNIDMLAPLGNGFTLKGDGKKAIAIGGGIGTPPMLGIADSYKESCTVIAGFRSASAVILEEDFKKCGSQTIVCTDDGTYGKKGFVTDALKECLANEKPDIIYACGPKPMLKAISEIAESNGILCEISLEERMGCGVGACLVCACKTKKNGEEKMSHVCKDGPVFDSREVVF